MVAASGFEPELWEPKSQVLAVTPCGNLWEERDSNPLTASPLRQFVNAGQIYSLPRLSNFGALPNYCRGNQIQTDDLLNLSQTI